MITLYSGTPGSGKSYHAVKVIDDTLRYKSLPVLTNLTLDKRYAGAPSLQRRMMMLPVINTVFKSQKNKKAKLLVEFDIYNVSPQFFVDYARKNLKPNKENQALIVIDECARIFNPRMDRSDRIRWIDFFQIHRHLGYNIILIAQHSRLLDRQITYLLEYNVIHRGAKNFKLLGKILSMLSGGNLFVAVRKWFGINEVESREWIRGSKSIYKLYNTYQDFDTTSKQKSNKTSLLLRSKDNANTTKNIKEINKSNTSSDNDVTISSITKS